MEPSEQFEPYMEHLAVELGHANQARTATHGRFHREDTLSAQRPAHPSLRPLSATRRGKRKKSSLAQFREYRCLDLDRTLLS